MPIAGHKTWNELNKTERKAFKGETQDWIDEHFSKQVYMFMPGGRISVAREGRSGPSDAGSQAWLPLGYVVTGGGHMAWGHTSDLSVYQSVPELDGTLGHQSWTINAKAQGAKKTLWAFALGVKVGTKLPATGKKRPPR